MNSQVSLHDQRMKRFCSAGLYFVTSQIMSAGRSTLQIVQSALAGGIKLIQLREKDLPAEEFLRLAVQVREETLKADALLIINDDIDLAISVGADGVHLGQDDYPTIMAREKGPDLIIGASSHNIEEACKAQKDGASYVNIGPLFETKTKNWTDEYLGIEGLTTISANLDIPFTVMGGIKKHHIPSLLEAGAQTIALVTAITMADDPEQASRDLLAEVKNRSK